MKNETLVILLPVCFVCDVVTKILKKEKEKKRERERKEGDMITYKYVT